MQGVQVSQKTKSGQEVAEAALDSDPTIVKVTPQKKKLRNQEISQPSINININIHHLIQKQLKKKKKIIPILNLVLKKAKFVQISSIQYNFVFGVSCKLFIAKLMPSPQKAVQKDTMQQHCCSMVQLMCRR